MDDRDIQKTGTSTDFKNNFGRVGGGNGCVCSSWSIYAHAQTTSGDLKTPAIFCKHDPKVETVGETNLETAMRFLTTPRENCQVKICDARELEGSITGTVPPHKYLYACQPASEKALANLDNENLRISEEHASLDKDLLTRVLVSLVSVIGMFFWARLNGKTNTTQRSGKGKIP